MVGRNIAVTVIVGLALGLIVLKYALGPWTRIQIVGLCLLLVSFVLWTVARFQLGNSLAVSAQAKQLVTRGLYSKIRNPIYVFASCAIAGLILALGRPVWLMVFVALIPLQIWRARKEFHVLRRKVWG